MPFKLAILPHTLVEGAMLCGQREREVNEKMRLTTTTTTRVTRFPDWGYCWACEATIWGSAAGPLTGEGVGDRTGQVLESSGQCLLSSAKAEPASLPAVGGGGLALSQHKGHSRGRDTAKSVTKSAHNPQPSICNNIFQGQGGKCTNHMKLFEESSFHFESLWGNSPPSFHYCQSEMQNVTDLAEMWCEIIDILQRNPGFGQKLISMVVKSKRQTNWINSVYYSWIIT